jgi:hypothetical protein
VVTGECLCQRYTLSLVIEFETEKKRCFFFVTVGIGVGRKMMSWSRVFMRGERLRKNVFF